MEQHFRKREGEVERGIAPEGGAGSERRGKRGLGKTEWM